ncbi:MAG: terpene cyclase/mutase family protein [Geobacter sp.]|nr:terpene cyclase/mutase family protein [Geobacter sp.]
MPHLNLPALLEAISGRTAADGGFAAHSGGAFNPEATAWGAIALKMAGARNDLISSALDKLASIQSSDGRVSFYSDHPEVFWPTPIALLAWHGSDLHRQNIRRAIDFLLGITGFHWQKPAGYPCDYDTAIRGWPWVTDAHSWVEPTALSLLALNVAGYGDHERCSEGIRMLLDRQLPHGGWNYGIPVMYEHEVPPQTHTTGIALAALEGCATGEVVHKSIDYLKKEISVTNTPLSLCWSILGLSAWGMRPSPTERLLAEAHNLRHKYGDFDTTLLSLLVIANHSEHGLKQALK